MEDLIYSRLDRKSEDDKQKELEYRYDELVAKLKSLEHQKLKLMMK